MDRSSTADNGTTLGQSTSTLASRPAPYGRACVNCVRAKCKCILRSSGSCERCFRLKKECSPSSSVRKKRSTPRTSSHTARLEQKLDGLVSLLRANSQGNIPADASNAPMANVAGSASSDAVPTPQGASSPSSAGKHANDERVVYNPSAVLKDFCISTRDPLEDRAQRLPAIDPITPASSSSSFPYTLARDVEPTTEEAELWYHIFQTKYTEHIPFIVPYLQNKSCSQLRQEKPFLWLSVMANACPSVQKQKNLGRAVREVVAREVVVEGERTIDLLLCIVCFIHWSHYHVQLGPLITVFSNLANSILIDLELDKVSPNELSTKNPGRIFLPKFGYRVEIPQSRTLEHRRLALAVYTVNTSCAAFHQKTESLTWTTYFEESLKILEEAKDMDTLDTDEYQVFQVKQQQILSNVTMIYMRMRGVDNEQATRLVIPFIHSFKKQLADLRAKLPDNIAKNKFMQLSLFYIEVAINETALIRTQFSNLMADRELDTMQCLITCFEAIQGWFNLFLTLDITEYVGVPFTSWKQLGLMIVTTVRLTTLEDPAWDTNHIRQELDLPSVLEAICENLRHVANLTPWKIDAEDNVYLRSMKYMNGLLTWARSVYAGFPVEAPTIDPVNGSIQHESGQIDMMTGENNSRQQQQQQQRQQNPSASLAPGQTLGPASAPATASAVAFPHQTQLPLPAEMFPYFHQDPWADGVLGFWDIYNNGKTYGNIY